MAKKTNPILDVFRENFDKYDPWGSTVMWHFAIADALLSIAPDTIPPFWEFRPSPFGADTETYEYQAILEAVAEGATIGHLIHAGNVLNRYAMLLSLAGKDY